MGAHELPFGATAADFGWAVGIEDTFVPQTRAGLRPLDEYELMGHYERWRDDLQLAKAAGARMLRWGIPWYRVEPAPGRFDWSWTDQVIPYIVDELGLQLIVDLMHYGTPSWLERSFAGAQYPDAVAAYARAVAERYGDRIHYWTPLNEPIVNAQMCGERGLWPPYLRGDRGYVAVGVNLALGIVRTVKALRVARPDAVMVHVEAAGFTRTDLPDLEPLVVERRRRDWLFLDLVTGRVDQAHPLWTWLLRNGARLADLHWLRANAIGLDVLGLNFYPQWSTQRLELDPGGAVRAVPTDPEGHVFGELITRYYERYRVPIMITETSAKDSWPIKRRWLEASVGAIKALRQSGLPVIGYTWFPLYTMVDWVYRTGRGPVEDYLIELGLYESQPAAEGQRIYAPTPLVDQYRALTLASAAAVGELGDT